MINKQKFLINIDSDSYSRKHRYALENHLGLEIVDFANADLLSNKIKYENRVTFYSEGLKKFQNMKILHGPYMGLSIHTLDNEIREISEAKIKTAVLAAEKIGCDKIVFHTGYIPLINIQSLVDRRINTQIQFWQNVVNSSSNITLCLENTWEIDPYFISSIVNGVGSERLKVCLDIAHMHVFSKVTLQNWLEELAAHISHMHWSDNNLLQDLHLGIGKGKITWNIIWETLDEYNLNSTVLVEAPEYIEESFDYLDQYYFNN